MKEIPYPYTKAEKKIQKFEPSIKNNLEALQERIHSFESMIAAYELSQAEKYQAMLIYLKSLKSLYVTVDHYYKRLNAHAHYKEDTIQRMEALDKIITASKETLKFTKKALKLSPEQIDLTIIRSNLKVIDQEALKIHDTEPYHARPFLTALYIFAGMSAIFAGMMSAHLGIGMFLGGIGAVLFMSGMERIKPNQLQDLQEGLDHFKTHSLRVNGFFAAQKREAEKKQGAAQEKPVENFADKKPYERCPKFLRF